MGKIRMKEMMAATVEIHKQMAVFRAKTNWAGNWLRKLFGSTNISEGEIVFIFNSR